MLIDTHAHLDLYTENLDVVLAEIKQHQIITVSNSVDLESYRLNCEIAGRSKLVIPVFGVHPMNASKYSDNLEQLDEAIASSPLLGEIGLDFKLAEAGSQEADQRLVFEYLLDAARKQEKYIIVHSKNSENEVLELIEKHDVHKIIMHWFTGSQTVFRKLADRGAFFTVGTDILYSTKTQLQAREIPLDQLLTETDNPLVSLDLPEALAMPRALVDIVERLARQRGTTESDINQAIERNFMSIIQKTPGLVKYSKKIARDLKNQRASR